VKPLRGGRYRFLDRPRGMKGMLPFPASTIQSVPQFRPMRQAGPTSGYGVVSQISAAPRISRSPPRGRSRVQPTVHRTRQRPRPLELPHPSRPVDFPEAVMGSNSPVFIDYLANGECRDVTPISPVRLIRRLLFILFFPFKRTCRSRSG
jgi:hypothetical protein